MKKIKIGIIGTGVGIRTHLKGFRLVEQAEVYAICGSSLERSREFATQYSIPVACADYRELCDMKELDLVCITAPNNFHKEMVKYAITAHKNIICEKPLVNTEAEAKELAGLANGYDKLLFVDHQLRFNPYISAIKKLIQNGVLGKIYTVRLNQQGMGFADPNAKWTWSFDGKEGGGVRLAMASHFTDLIQYWFGNPEIESVFGYLNPITKCRNNKQNELTSVDASTVCFAMINFTNELTVQYTINAGSYSGSKFDISIFGDAGELTFTLQDKIKLYLRNQVGVVNTIQVEDVMQDEKENKVSIFSGTFRYLAPIVVNAIISNDFSALKRAASFNDACYNLRVLDAIKKSANTGATIIFKKGTNNYV
jgi:oxidoreductase domain protein